MQTDLGEFIIERDEFVMELGKQNLVLMDLNLETHGLTRHLSESMATY